MLRAINNSKYASRNGEKLTYKLSVVFVTTFLVVSPFESFLQSWIIFADGTGALHLVRKGLLSRERGTKRVFKMHYSHNDSWHGIHHIKRV